jgi:hypothetical protein
MVIIQSLFPCILGVPKNPPVVWASLLLKSPKASFCSSLAPNDDENRKENRPEKERREQQAVVRRGSLRCACAHASVLVCVHVCVYTGTKGCFGPAGGQAESHGQGGCGLCNSCSLCGMHPMAGSGKPGRATGPRMPGWEWRVSELTQPLKASGSSGKGDTCVAPLGPHPWHPAIQGAKQTGARKGWDGKSPLFCFN